MNHKYKPGDTVKVISSTSQHNGQAGVVEGYTSGDNGFIRVKINRKRHGVQNDTVITLAENSVKPCQITKYNDKTYGFTEDELAAAKQLLRQNQAGQQPKNCWLRKVATFARTITKG